MSFPKYEVYKDSGVEWLGEVPSHWETMPFFSRFRERKGQNTGLQENNLPSLSYGRIVEKDINTLDGLLPESFETYQIVNPCDIVFRLTDLQNDKRSLRSAIVQRKGIITSAYLAVEGLNIDSCFANYLFRAYDLLKVFYSMGGGLRQSMKYSDMKWLPISTPPSSEQRQIADFLDRETTRIDALIAEQQRLIELLKEKRQAVISHAVTKGIDRTAPMKDSGVEWLGEVPEHWEVSRLKHIAKIVDCKNRTPEYVDNGEYLVVRTSNVKEQKLNIDGAYYTDKEHFEIWTQRGIPPVGSILFTREAPTGEVCLVPEDINLCMGQRMMNIIPHDLTVTNFLFDYLTSDCLTIYIQSESAGSTVTHLRVEQVHNIPIVVPPPDEQVSIDKLVRDMKYQFTNLVELAKKVLISSKNAALPSSPLPSPAESTCVTGNPRPAPSPYTFAKILKPPNQLPSP